MKRVRKVVRRSRHGSDRERRDADMAGVTAGTEHIVVGGSVGGSSSHYLLEGFGKTRFNTVLFSGSWEDHVEVMDVMGMDKARN